MMRMQTREYAAYYCCSSSHADFALCPSRFRGASVSSGCGGPLRERDRWVGQAFAKRRRFALTRWRRRREPNVAYAYAHATSAPTPEMRELLEARQVARRAAVGRRTRAQLEHLHRERSARAAALPNANANALLRGVGAQVQRGGVRVLVERRRATCCRLVSAEAVAQRGSRVLQGAHLMM